MNSSIYNIYNTLLIHILQAYLLHKIKATIDAKNPMAKFHFPVGIHNYGQTGSARPKLHGKIHKIYRATPNRSAP